MWNKSGFLSWVRAALLMRTQQDELFRMWDGAVDRSQSTSATLLSSQKLETLVLRKQGRLCFYLCIIAVKLGVKSRGYRRVLVNRGDAGNPKWHRAKKKIRRQKDCSWGCRERGRTVKGLLRGWSWSLESTGVSESSDSRGSGEAHSFPAEEGKTSLRRTNRLIPSSAGLRRPARPDSVGAWEEISDGKVKYWRMVARPVSCEPRAIC